MADFDYFGFIATKDFLIWLVFQSFDFEVPDEGDSRNVSCTLNLKSTSILLSDWVDTSAGRLLVPGATIHPVVSASALTWSIRCIYY